MSNIRKNTLTSLLIAAVLATSAGVYASSGSDKTAAFNQSQINATQAVEAAIGSVSGKATEVDFKYKKGQSYYEVEVIAADGQKHEIKVDSNSGAVLESKIDSDKDSDDAAKAAAPISLLQAIETAKSQAAGEVKEAELKNKDGQSYYSISVVQDNQTQKVRIDSNTGAVISVQAKN